LRAEEIGLKTRKLGAEETGKIFGLISAFIQTGMDLHPALLCLNTHLSLLSGLSKVCSARHSKLLSNE
ncbi:MAG TPA: hypothetical protein PLL06_00735, partial [Acidobacteriota bacterium]|nr:hypothetical protein [Acidobacteriota bacterium]